MTSPRMKELQISSQGILNIDTMELPESCVVVISDGRAKLADLPPHANTTIKTHKGIVTRVNWDEGESF
ncbi:XtrA/YqaO family protein [Sporosarcina sp. FSL K6-3457]|uniref:XtrA/YqaO family protein n=1 Tax=Sporosarcina sp. FSL K6-3457 TaxID=2978204 RepID=UPI0030F4F6DF